MVLNDVKNSVIYFSKFAKLLRYNLNNSSINFVNLIDEIDFLKNYISLENLRFTYPFEFSIKFADELDIKLLKVPPSNHSTSYRKCYLA